MKVIVSDEIGFCYGVNRAYNECLMLDTSEKKTYIYGLLVHNDQVVGKLQKEGISYFEDINNLPVDSRQSRVIVRAHGIGSYDMSVLRNSFAHVLDMTCPIVSAMVGFAKKMQDSGYYIIAFGKKNHAEMIGLLGSIDPEKAVITDRAVTIQQSRVCILSQTTMDTNEFKEFLSDIIKKNDFSDIIVKNTICFHTVQREKQTAEIAVKADMVLIIGSSSSSNTRKLYDIACRDCSRSYLIQTSEDLKKLDFSQVKTIGVLSGTSAPLWEIEKIIDAVHMVDCGNFS